MRALPKNPGRMTSRWGHGGRTNKYQAVSTLHATERKQNHQRNSLLHKKKQNRNRSCVLHTDPNQAWLPTMFSGVLTTPRNDSPASVQRVDMLSCLKEYFNRPAPTKTSSHFCPRINHSGPHTSPRLRTVTADKQKSFVTQNRLELNSPQQVPGPFRQTSQTKTNQNR